MKMELKPLTDALAIIGKITGTDLISMKLAKGVLRMNGENGGRSMTVTVPYKEKGAWELAIGKSALDQTFKGRKELDITIEDNGHIKFKANTFEAQFATQPYNSGPELHQAESVDITEAQQDALDHGLQVASLAPVYEGDTIFCVDMNKKASLVACFDQLHFAFVEGPGVDGTLAFAFPTKTFEVVADAARKSKYKLSTTSASICAWNDNWQLVLPFIQNEVEQSIKNVKEMADSFGTSLARCSADKLIKAIESAASAIETGGAILISAKDDTIRVSGESSIGKVSERLECKRLSKKWTDLNIDPSVILSLLANVPCEFIEFGIHADKFFFIRAEDETTKITYGGLLSEAQD